MNKLLFLLVIVYPALSCQLFSDDCVTCLTRKCKFFVLADESTVCALKARTKWTVANTVTKLTRCPRSVSVSSPVNQKIGTTLLPPTTTPMPVGTIIAATTDAVTSIPMSTTEKKTTNAVPTELMTESSKTAEFRTGFSSSTKDKIVIVTASEMTTSENTIITTSEKTVAEKTPTEIKNLSGTEASTITPLPPIEESFLLLAEISTTVAPLQLPTTPEIHKDLPETTEMSVTTVLPPDSSALGFLDNTTITEQPPPSELKMHQYNDTVFLISLPTFKFSRLKGHDSLKFKIDLIKNVVKSICETYHVVAAYKQNKKIPPRTRRYLKKWNDLVPLQATKCRKGQKKASLNQLVTILCQSHYGTTCYLDLESMTQITRVKISKWNEMNPMKNMNQCANTQKFYPSCM